MRLDQYSWLGSIPRYGMSPSLAQRLDHIPILLSHNEGQPLFGQSLANAPPHTTVAYKDHMICNIARRNRGGQFRQRIVRALQNTGKTGTGAYPGLGRFDHTEHERI